MLFDLGGLTVYSRITYIPHWYPWGYNNPVTVVAAIAFLCFWLSFDFKSRFINSIAKGCLGVYILHSSAFLGETVLFGFVGNISSWALNRYGLFAGYFYLTLLAVVTVIVILSIDYLRRLLVQPIWNFIDKRS